MFKWFSKDSSVVPTDIKNALLTSTNCTLKIGTQINIPANVVCYVSYKDKIYCEKEQELIINSDNLQDLIARQSKDNKAKKLTMDLFFVNKNEQEKEFSYKDKIKLDFKLNKVKFNIRLSLNIENPKKFLSFALSELALPNALDSDNLLNTYLIERIKSYFLRKNLDEPTLNDTIINEVQVILQKFLKSIGIKLVNFNLHLSLNGELQPKKISIFDKSNETTKNALQDQLEETVENVDKIENNDYNMTATQNEKEQQPKADNLCPNCKHKVIKGSKYCHICGAILY